MVGVAADRPRKAPLIGTLAGKLKEKGFFNVIITRDKDMMQLVDWVLDDRPSIATAEHARHVIDIIESGYRAAETGRTQELTTTFTP